MHAPELGGHRLLASGRSAALIRTDGEIDWWCAPDVDDPPILWSLLDPSGGRARWADARMARRCMHPAGPATTTTLMIGGVPVECWDGLVAVEGGGAALVRLVRTRDDPLDLAHELWVGGFDQPLGEWVGSAAQLGSTSIHVAGGESTVIDGRLETRVRAPGGQAWTAVVISAGEPVAADANVLASALRSAEDLARRRLTSVLLPRHHPSRAADALAVLDACTFAPTGAVIASPTTSVPEAPGADRQFDYRYSWLRDASIAVSVAALVGQRGTAEKYLAFIGSIADDALVPSGPMVDVRGNTVPDERPVGGVEGWAASQPIRVGNAAADQVQLDALGLLVEAVSVHLQTGGRLDRSTWKMVRQIADKVAIDATEYSNGIWELREAAPLVNADIGRWMTLDRAIWITRGWRPFARRRRWKQARAAACARVLDAIDDDGLISQRYDRPGIADASVLMAVIFGMFDRGDPRGARLVDQIICRLDAWPFLYRYEPGSDDGFHGLEGAFIPTSWWAVHALAVTGRLDEAIGRADAMCDALPRLLSEEIDAGAVRSLGNVPLLWSHMEAARTMYILDAEVRRRRWGPAGLWVWRLARYARLRFRSAEEVGDEPCVLLDRSVSATYASPAG